MCVRCFVSFRRMSSWVVYWLACACVVLEVASESPKNRGVKKQLVQSIRIDDSSNIWVFDNVLDQQILESLYDLAHYPQALHQFIHQDFEYSVKNGLTPFISVLNATEFADFKVHNQIKKLVEKSLKTKVKLNQAYVELLHSLDPKPPVKEFCHKNVFYVSLYLVRQWKHNSYGQMSFYTMSTNPNLTMTKRKEIVHTVHPKPGRIVIWPSCVLQALHPPSVNYFANIPLLRLKYITAAAEDAMPDGLALITPDKPKLSEWKFENDDSNREIDYGKHLTRSYFDSKKRGIYVLDDLYTTSELQQFRDILLKAGGPVVSIFDGSPLEDNDNVQWIDAYEVAEFVKTPVWSRLQDLLYFITKENEWYPYDVALNYIRPADHTRIHPDAEKHQIEYTFLLYLTENVTQNDFGETVFFEKEKRMSDGIHRFTNPGGEEYEPIAAVWPKYGRVVLFRNLIEHSARPLSTARLDCRYTFATKVSRSKRLSFIKQVYEKMEGVITNTNYNKELNRKLSTGQHDDPAKSPLTTDMLEKTFQDIVATKAKQLKEYRLEITSNLS